MNIKTKPLTEAGNLGFNNKVRPSVEINATEYKRSIGTMLLTNEVSSYLGRFKYNNLPPGLSSKIIETMLYYKGQLALFKVGDKFYILPFVYTGTINQYGIQEEIIPIPFNGTIDDKSSVQSFAGNYRALLFDYGEESYDPSNTAVILRERSSLYFGATVPTIVLTDEVRDKLAENTLLVRNNILLSHPIKYVSIESQDKSTSVDAQMSNMFNHILQGKLVQSIVGHLKLDSVSSNPPSIQVQQLWQNFASLDALRLTSLGIVNNGTFEKRERILTDEIKGKQVESQAILDDHLTQRQDWAKLVNKVFGTNISVELSEILKPNEEEKVDSREGNKTKQGYEVDYNEE